MTSFERYWAHPLLSDHRRVRHDDMDKALNSPNPPRQAYATIQAERG